MSTTRIQGIKRFWPFFVLGAAVVLYSLTQYGCTDRHRGTEKENLAPQVQFVNIPPDGTQTSRNPVVFWFGSDADGQVTMYRYVVVLLDSMGGLDPDDYVRDVLPTFSDSRWTYLMVDVNDPKTKSGVPMSADLEDPVLAFNPQYVFLQAFDDQGEKSSIVYRLFLRNDNPPVTRLILLGGDEETPFVNSVLPGGAITGVRLRWRGEDKVDHPKDPPPFSYQWKLFGPYQYRLDTLIPGPDTFDILMEKFQKIVFAGSDGLVYELTDTIFRCDTVAGVYDCDTFPVAAIAVSSPLGRRDTIFNVDDPEFLNDTEHWNKLIASSDGSDGGWVTDSVDTFYDMFKLDPADTTRQMKFIFWVRTRDDAYVPDPTPAFRSFDVLDPHFEREILVIDFNNNGPNFRRNAPYYDIQGGQVVDSSRVFWENAIKAWDPAIDYSTSRDFLQAKNQTTPIRLANLVKYKVLICYNDDVRASGISSFSGTGSFVTTDGRAIYSAIDAGVNAWLTMRAPIAGDANLLPLVGFPGVVTPDHSYQFYWGVQYMTFTGWEKLARPDNPIPLRVEDFIGAYSIQPETWPDLLIDTTLLHRRYEWLGGAALGWRDSIGAQPSVDWSYPAFGTERLYLFKSLYGTEHFMPDPNFNFEGAPIAHLTNAGLFKTAHFNFTPLPFPDVQGFAIVKNVLDFLYDPAITAPPVDVRYPDAPVKVSKAQISQNHEERLIEAMKEKAVKEGKDPNKIFD